MSQTSNCDVSYTENFEKQLLLQVSTLKIIVEITSRLDVHNFFSLRYTYSLAIV